MAKNNSILIRMSENDIRILNKAWYAYTALVGHPVSRSEFIRNTIMSAAGAVADLEFLEAVKEGDSEDGKEKDEITSSEGVRPIHSTGDDGGADNI